MKVFTNLCLLILVVACKSFPADKPVHHTPNFFAPKKDKIDFPYITPTSFEFRTSSCYDPDTCVQNLFDANSKTLWKSEASEKSEWLLLDFGKKRLMNRLFVELPKTSNIHSYKVQVLKRGKWFTLYENKTPSAKNLDLFGNIDATLLRIYIRKKRKGVLYISNLQVQLNDANLTGIQQNLTGYCFPISHALFPGNDYSLPGAPRAYRNGIHKGIDISYKNDKNGNRVKLTRDDPVLAIGDGVIVRADKNYQPMTEKSYLDAIEYTKNNRVTYVDRDFGGRQIWIDHRNGVMSSYNHLSSIEEKIEVGSHVKKGQPIGTVGNSGLKGEAYGTDSSIHLHLEIWIDGEFAGKGLNANQSKKLMQFFFTE